MNDYIPLWLFKEVLSSIEQHLRLFVEIKHEDEIDPKSVEIRIVNMYDRDAVRIELRCWAKKKGDYAGMHQDVSRKLIFETSFKPPYHQGKTSEEMMGEIMEKLNPWDAEKKEI